MLGLAVKLQFDLHNTRMLIVLFKIFNRLLFVLIVKDEVGNNVAFILYVTCIFLHAFITNLRGSQVLKHSS
jgi:hypothetical protein